MTLTKGKFDVFLPLNEPHAKLTRSAANLFIAQTKFEQGVGCFLFHRRRSVKALFKSINI